MRSRQSNDGRRIYVFTTVALAVFVLSIAAVGFTCHGFATGSTSGRGGGRPGSRRRSGSQQAAVEAEAQRSEP